MHVAGRWLLGMPRTGRRILAGAVDAVLLAASMMLAATWRLGDAALHERGYLRLALVAAVVGTATFWAFGLYREVIRYAGPRIWLRIGLATGAVTVLLAAGNVLFGERDISRAVLIGFGLVSAVACGGSRMLAAQILAGRRPESGFSGEATPVLIYGAGASGAGLAAALSHSPLYRPSGFIDDDPRIVGSRIRDLTVHSGQDLARLRERFPNAIVALAIPSASTAERRRVLERLRPLGMRIMTVPGLRELMVGEAGFGQLRELNIEDLLGRDSVKPNEHLLARCITGRSVLVSGAGGTIGGELCRQIIRLRPSRLVLLEQGELALYQIESELAAARRQDPELAKVPVFPVLGSVTGGVLVEELLREHRVQTIYHAAAHKHVNIVETNEITGVVTNTFGTATMARAAIKARVETFVLISTDKAVRPSSVMGASKRLAELVLQDLAGDGPAAGIACPTRFVMVRFGNVLGSSGSVVPLFLRQIAAGGPITVTHPDVTRYFMTVSEAVNLVIQAGSLGRGGEIFILDMGEPVRIVDLARNLIGLQGFSVRDASRPDGDIAIEFIGLQPGEKLHETLVAEGTLENTEHPKISRAFEPGLRGGTLRDGLARLESACDRHDTAEARRILQELVAIPSTRPAAPGT